MKIGAYSEVMLRLSPPEYALLEQATQLRFDFTGTGVNVLSNLAHFNEEALLLTHLPNNRLGDCAEKKCRHLGIDPSHIKRKHDHMGSYIAENGYGTRPTIVTYQNRTESAFCLSGPADYDLAHFIDSVDLVMICGISLSLTENTKKTALELAKRAHAARKTVCFDFNFRPGLNTTKAHIQHVKALYHDILPYCDIVFGSKRDLVELLHLQDTMPETEEEEVKLIKTFLKKYRISTFAGTIRHKINDVSHLTGQMVTEKNVYRSKPYKLTALDRIGAGDAYTAGILLGFALNFSKEDHVNFATANAALAHTIHGDVPLTTVSLVRAFMENEDIDLMR